MGQGKLMGSICCTRIPFILVAINQSHLSPLLRPYSANPPVDPKTHISTGTIELFFVMILTTHICLQTYVLCLALFLVTITPYCTFSSQSWWFCLLSAPLWFHCLHTPYCYLFLANWSMCSPALNFWIYKDRIYRSGFFNFNIVGLSSPLLPCRLVDLRRGLLYSENLQHPPSLSPHSTAPYFRLHFCAWFAFPSLGALVKADI